MQPKVIKTEFAQYEKARWSGKNESGYEPVGDRVLVLPDVAMHKTTGGIELPEPLQERLTMSAETGVLAAMGEGAFMWNGDGTKFVGTKPKLGDRVFIERYAGQLITGIDGNKYRVMDYKCIGAIQVKE